MSILVLEHQPLSPHAPASRAAENLVADARTLEVRNIRPWGRDAVAIEVQDGMIVSITPHSPTVPADAQSPTEKHAATEAAAGLATGTKTPPTSAQPNRVIDGRGLLALPGFANVHAHSDKSWWGHPWQSYGGVATTQGRIEHEREHRDSLGIPGAQTSTNVMREYLRHGTTVQRTHVDVDLGIGLRGIEAVHEANEALGGSIVTQVVAFPQDGVLRRPGVLELLDEAAAAGADYIGGLDPASIDRDPVGQLDGIFAIAERRGCGIDVHLHDGGELGAFQIELMIERTLRHGLQGKVNVAHGLALGQLPASRQADLIAAMAEAGVSMTSVSPIRVAPLPLRELLEAGVAVGLGTDGFRDLWGPYGDGDMLKVALKTAQVCGLRYDEDLILAVELASSRGAAFAGLASHNLQVGDRADIVLLDAENTMDALTRTPNREFVVACGKVVVADGKLLV